MKLDEQTLMIADTVRKFVERELIPLEPVFAARQVAVDDEGPLTPDMVAHLRAVSHNLGLWGLDAPEEFGGLNLPHVTMAAVAEELGRTITCFTLPPDTPNLKMLAAVGSAEQKEKYLKPYVEGKLVSGIAISEPGAGSDPAGIRMKAEPSEDGWVLNGRKIWITNAAKADFLIVMARVGPMNRRDGITAFIVDRNAEGFSVERAIPMVADTLTYELVFEDCRIPASAVLGKVGTGYEPMQLRLISRRLEMASTCVGMTERVLDILCRHVTQRTTFGQPLADRQVVQWWIADISTRLHAARLMIHDAAEKADAGHDVRHEASMLKVYSTEMAYQACDHAMQALGAMGMTKELPLYHLWQRARIMRVYEGPTEVHLQSVAKRVLAQRK